MSSMDDRAHPSEDGNGDVVGVTRRRLLRAAGGGGAFLAAAPVLTACGELFGSSGEGEDKGVVTIEFWNTFSEAEITLLHKMGDEYMKQNPRVKIKFLEVPYDQRATKIPSAIETNSLPDVMRADYPYQWLLATRGKLTHLEDHLAGWVMRDRIYDVAWREVTYEGHIVGIPQDKFTNVFVYNQDLFRKADIQAFPSTWDEFVDACRRLTGKARHGLGWHGSSLFVPLLLQAGGRLVDEDGRIAFNEEPGVTALQFMLDLVKKHKVTPPGIAAWEYANTDNALKGQKIAMAPLGSWIIGNYRQAAVEWKLGIGAMPAGPGGRGAVSAASMYMVTNTSKHQKEAIDLVKWLVEPANALRWAKTLEHEPIDKGTASNPHFQDSLFKPFEESLEFASPLPAIPEFQAALEAALGQNLQKALLGKSNPKKALDDAADQGQKVLTK